MAGMLERWLRKLEERRDGLAGPSANREQAAAGARSLSAGNAALAAGDLATAAEHYRAAISAQPENPAGHVNLAYVFLEQGDFAGAQTRLQDAIAKGAGADAHFMLGQGLATQHQWPQAAQSLETAVILQPDFAFAWEALGAVREQLGDIASALVAFERALQASPGMTTALGGRARTLSQLGRSDEAVDAARRWAAASPTEWAAPFVEAQGQHKLGHHRDALEALDRALAIEPAHPAILHTQGNVFFALGLYAEAERSYAQAAAGAPDWLEPLVNRGVALDRLARPEDALGAFDEVLARDPQHKLALYWRPIVLFSLHRTEEALRAVGEARERHPMDADMEWHYAFSHLLAGRTQEGWPAYESRWRAASVAANLRKPAHAKPEWTGQPLEGKTLLLYPEQGLGDTLQFIRFVPALEARGARVLLEVPQTLAAVAATVSPNVVVGTSAGALPPFDYQCPLLSVPLGLGQSLDDLPGPIPYARVDSAKSREWGERLGPRRGLRVGVIWSGNAAQPNDHNRSIPLATFADIAAPGCEFVAMQNAVRPQDEMALREWKGLRFFGDELGTFADTAALAAQMDLVVTVCTSGAHLAGALGLPMWVLLAYRADWRWLLDRDDSPWYPTARLFRQDATRRWPAVIARVREELTRRASA